MNVMLVDAATITSTAGFGVNLAATNQVWGGTTEAAFNQVSYDASGITLSGTSGGMTIDGTTPLSLAALRLLAGKVSVDATKFNRAISQ
jgi:hypothetical protein